jgi:Domain of unknown function (DUF4124)
MRAVLVLLVLLALPAHAQVYRWVDEAGKVQYSNALPPPSANSLQRGMSEGELFVIAGAPDLHTRDRSFSTYTYLPTAAEPFITTIELVRGRISEIERVRRF